MNRRWLALAWSMTLLCAGCSDEAAPTAARPGTYPLDTWVVPWSVGDVAEVASTDETVTETSTETKDPISGQTATVRRRKTETVSAVARTEALQVDANGTPTRRRVAFQAWSALARETLDGADLPAATDSSLLGVRLEVTWQGRVGAYTILTEGAAPTPAARAWLEARYVTAPPEGRELDRIGRPSSPVHAGAVWMGDSSLGLYASLGHVEMGTRTRPGYGNVVWPVELRFEGAADGMGLATSKVSLKHRAWELGPGVLAWFRRGGEQEGTITLAFSLTPGRLDAEMTTRLALRGTAYADDLMSSTIDVEQTIARTWAIRRADVPTAPK